MKKTIKKISLVLFLVASIVVGFTNSNNNVYAAAAIGYQLADPEAGWQRIDDEDSRFSYSEGCESFIPTKEYMAYKQTLTKIKNRGNGCDTVTFKFTGKKLRIIAQMDNWYKDPGCKDVKITIDDVDYNFRTNYVVAHKALAYSNENIGKSSDEEHTVTITALGEGTFWFDAIDIDEDGKLLGSDDLTGGNGQTGGNNPTDTDEEKVSEITLDKTDLTMNIGETQDVVATVSTEDAADKSVTWTSSDESICIVDENGEITAVSPGEAVVTATANDGSGMSASCNVTVVDGRRGVLTINMNNAKQYTYDMSMAEINEFTNWYNNISKDQGDAYYIIDSNPQSGAYKSDSHYFNYNNISDFIINTY